MAEAGSSSGDANLSYEIKNIDRKGPTIQTISYDKDVYSTGKQIVVGAIDIQENGEEGSGLDQYPFALDEGDWQEENSFLVESNGIHMIRVMDRLGNIQEQEFEVSMIDREGPIIQSSSVSPEESTLGNVVLTIEAIDLNGIGLHEMAFSFDGGNTWGAENSIVLTKNQMIPVVVRDKLENKTEKKIHITNIIVPETDNQKKEEESQSEEAPQNIEQGEIPLVTATPISVISERKYPVKAVTEQDELERNKENQNLNKEERQEKELEKRGAEPEQVTIENVADYSNNRRQKVIIALTLIAILTLVLFGGMLLNYFYYNIVLIYEISDGDQERYLGMTFLRKKETFYLTISKKICDKSNTIFYRLKLSEIVDNRHHAETLFIITEHEKFTYYISDAIDFTLEK